MTDQWLGHVPAFLEAAGIADTDGLLAKAQLALMLAEHGETSVVRVPVLGNKVAWCRTYSGGWGCVAIAPKGDRWDCDSVPRDVFFAGRWPKGWITPGSVRKATARAADGPMTLDGMAWANDPAGGVRVARIACLDPLMLEMNAEGFTALADETGLSWRPFAHNADGLEVEWREGRVTFANFKFAAMRAGLRAKHLRQKADKGGMDTVRKVAREAMAPFHEKS